MTGRLLIAVCTNRSPAEAGEALSALLRQAPEGALALVTSGLRATEVEAHRSAFSGAVLEEPREGLSRARNRALDWCGPDDVLAFVDDDAVVADGWYAALERRWGEAPAALACIGGPIRPRWPGGEPPAWISPPILPALTLIDLGPEVRDLDPFVTTVYGANISFRAAALRRVGGFDPAFGHSGARVFFSEEDEAQRALARLGLGVRYVPDAAVEHVIPPERLTRASFVRRRFAYGQALGLRRARSRRLAARQALSSGLGTVAALGRGQLFMERAVRAAENLGVLYGSTRPRRIA
ncbi:MAG TPA: glycosyltransferase [Thermoleophilaceae bacterium]